MTLKINKVEEQQLKDKKITKMIRRDTCEVEAGDVFFEREGKLVGRATITRREPKLITFLGDMTDVNPYLLEPEFLKALGMTYEQFKLFGKGEILRVWVYDIERIKMYGEPYEMLERSRGVPLLETVRRLETGQELIDRLEEKYETSIALSDDYDGCLTPLIHYIKDNRLYSCYEGRLVKVVLVDEDGNELDTSLNNIEKDKTI